MIISQKEFSWKISHNYTAILSQAENGTYTGQVRSKETGEIEAAVTCKTCAEFYQWLNEHANQFETIKKSI